MITVPNSRIVTLIVRVDKEPELVTGIARRERYSVHTISPKDVTILIDKHIHRQFQDEFKIKNGIFIKHPSFPPEKGRYRIYPPDERCDFVLVFLDGFQRINFKLNNVSFRKGLGEKVSGGFIYNLKRGAGCYFEIAGRAYILEVTESKMSILSLSKGRTVSEC